MTTYIYSIQSRLKIKNGNKKQRWSLHNDKGFNSSRRYKIINISAPIFRALKNIKQILTDLRGDTANTIIVGDFNGALSKLNRSSREKINMEMLDLNYILDQIDLINIYRHSIQQQQNAHSSQAHTEQDRPHSAP